jgi:hypothetical protein
MSINIETLLENRHRLEIHWEKVSYNQEGTAVLEGCSLSGPILSEVSEMEQEDSIALDFTNQYIVFIPNYYIARLAWSGVKHTQEKIYLYNAVLKNKSINSVPKLQDEDYIVIDTENHEDDKHMYHLTYPSYLIKPTGELYNFGG